MFLECHGPVLPDGELWPDAPIDMATAEIAKNSSWAE